MGFGRAEQAHVWTSRPVRYLRPFQDKDGPCRPGTARAVSRLTRDSEKDVVFCGCILWQRAPGRHGPSLILKRAITDQGFYGPWGPHMSSARPNPIKDRYGRVVLGRNGPCPPCTLQNHTPHARCQRMHPRRHSEDDTALSLFDARSNPIQNRTGHGYKRVKLQTNKRPTYLFVGNPLRNSGEISAGVL